jgi:hypothetical protein
MLNSHSWVTNNRRVNLEVDTDVSEEHAATVFTANFEDEWRLHGVTTQKTIIWTSDNFEHLKVSAK